MARPRLNEQEMQVLWAEVSKYMTPVILERGLEYYQRGRVSNIQESTEDILATVRGSEPYFVIIDKQEFRSGSRCSCPYESFCKHMAAVFFAVYEDFGNPEELRWDWNNPHQPSKSSALNRGMSTSPSGRSAAKQEPLLQMPEQTSPFSEWEAYLEQRLADVVDGRSAYENDWQRSYDKIEDKIDALIDEADAWADEQYVVYTTLARLVAIRRVFTRLVNEGMTERHWYFRNPPLLSVARELVGNLDLDLSSWSEAEVLQIPLQRARELDSFLRSFMARELANTTVPVEAFQTIWLHILQHLENPIEVASEWLLSLSSNRTAGINQTRAVTMLYVLGGDDAAAKRGLAENPNMDWSYVLLIPSLLWALGAGERALDWLKWMGSQLTPDDKTMIPSMSDLWLKVGYVSEEAADEALRFLKNHKSFMGYNYSQGLMQFGRYKAWIEIQLLDGLLPNHISKENMKWVEKEGLEHLLPLYHQTVERMVAQKNRASYRIAARWLKKLRTYYKKLKRTDEWDGFVLRFKDKYSRLRALQEELVRAGIDQ